VSGSYDVTSVWLVLCQLKPRRLFETQRLFETRQLLNMGLGTPAFIRDPVFIQDPAFIESFTVNPTISCCEICRKLTHRLESTGFFLSVLRSQHVSHLNIFTDATVCNLIVHIIWFNCCATFRDIRLFLQESTALFLGKGIALNPEVGGHLVLLYTHPVSNLTLQMLTTLPGPYPNINYSMQRKWLFLFSSF